MTMIGKTFSHYRVVEKLGEGGMGEIYLAEDTKLKRTVALKFLPAELTGDASRKQRFLQEAHAAAAIQHPHVAAIHDIDEIDGRTFIAMEHVRGESLRQAIRDRKLSLRKCLDLAIQVADGLAAAHQRGVVHRDLKPENVLVSEQGYAKIIDFGLAKLIEPLTPGVGASHESEIETQVKTRDGLVMGTVAYMSPEQARGEAVDARSDVFSFGAMLYEMVSGKSPFLRTSAVETLSAVLKETPPPPSLESGESPPELMRILRKTMAKDPEERYQSMKDLALDLKELRDTLTSVERPAVREAHPPRKFWIAAVLFSIAMLAGLGVYLSSRRGAPSITGSSGRPSIAILSFEDHSGSPDVQWLSAGVPSMLVTGLAQTPGLDVVSSQRLQEILDEMGEGDAERIDPSRVPELDRRAGAGAVVVGSIFKAGDEVRIDVQVEDVGSGRVLSAESVRGTDVFPLVDELTERIRASLSVGDRGSEKSIAEVTTPSLEAYQLYTQGVQASRNLRWADARDLLEKAVQIDPSFAMAYRELAQIARTIGDERLAQQYGDKVREHLERLPERQKLLAEADAAREKGDVAGAVAVLQDLVARYPDEESGYRGLLGLYANYLNDLPQARAIAERGIEALPRSGPLHNNYGYLLLAAGEYPRAIREFETYVSLNPNEPNPYDSLAEAYLVTGQPQKAIERYTKALEVDSTFLAPYLGRAWAYGMLGRFPESLEQAEAFEKHMKEQQLPVNYPKFFQAFILSRVGRYREAVARTEEGLAESRRIEDRRGESSLLALQAMVALERGRPAEVYPAVETAQATFPDLNTRDRSLFETLTALLAGVAQARQGDLETARKQLEAIDSDYDPRNTARNWWRHALEGEIALAEGNLAGAESAFSAGAPELKMFFNNGDSDFSVLANALPFRDGMARVKEAQGDLPGAIEVYRQILTPDMSNKWTTVLEPRYVLALARLLQENGDTDAAREQYTRFLELWKEADPGLPELQEARRGLASIR